MLNNKTKIIATTVALVLVVALIFLARGCGHKDEVKADTTANLDQNAHEVLQQPAMFDPRSLDEFAQAINDGREFNVEEISLMIVACEAAINEHGQAIEQLDANDDAADAWNTLTEYKSLPWPGHLHTILTYLKDKATLNDEQISRLQALNANIHRYNTIIAHIESNQLDGQSTGFRLNQ